MRLVHRIFFASDQGPMWMINALPNSGPHAHSAPPRVFNARYAGPGGTDNRAIMERVFAHEGDLAVHLSSLANGRGWNSSMARDVWRELLVYSGSHCPCVGACDVANIEYDESVTPTLGAELAREHLPPRVDTLSVLIVDNANAEAGPIDQGYVDKTVGFMRNYLGKPSAAHPLHLYAACFYRKAYMYADGGRNRSETEFHVW